MKIQAKVVIIGGGAVGVSTLYHLAKAGVTDTLLIEKNELTSGSTWHAAGNIPTCANSWGGMRAGNYAWRLFKGLAEEVDYPITYRHTGAFWPAHTPERMDLFRHLVGISKGLGYGMAMLTPSEMDRMHPYFSSGESIIGGIYDPYEGDVDPSQLTQALAKSARDQGAAIQRFTRVTGIRRRASGEWEVETGKGNVRCDIVINAGGYYGRQVGGAEAASGDAGAPVSGHRKPGRAGSQPRELPARARSGHPVLPAPLAERAAVRLLRPPRPPGLARRDAGVLCQPALSRQRR